MENKSQIPGYRTATLSGLADRALDFQKETVASLKREKKMQDWNFNKKMELLEAGDDKEFWQSLERRIDRKLSSKERQKIRSYWKNK
jgi:hypothetical protein